MDYYRHYMDGTTEVVHYCDQCDERVAVFFTEDSQLCRECHTE